MHFRQSVWRVAVRSVLAPLVVFTAAWPALATDFKLAPSGNGPLPAGRTAADVLQRQPLADGDRVLLTCGERYAPLRLRTRGVGSVRIEPASACAPGKRPVFDGRRPPGEPVPVGDRAEHAGRSVYIQRQTVVQVFAGDQPLPRARHPARGYLLISPGTVASDTALPPDARFDPAGLAGAILLARTQEWFIETRQVGANGRTLDAALRYPLRSKAGVFFTGKAWMLGNGQGWAHDRLAQTLTVQGAGSQPVTAALDEPLLQVHGSAGVDVQGVDFFGAGGNGVDVKSDGSVLLRDLVLTLSGSNAVSVAGAKLAQVEQVHVDRSGEDGIFFAEVARAEVRDSTVREAGLLHGAGPALAAINAHRTDAAVIERNRVERSGYIGIRVSGDAVVQGNRVAASCINLADCAAIYTWRRGRDDHRAPLRVLGNLVVGVGGDASVKFGVTDYFAGIYLDEWTRRTEVRGNLLIDVGQGIYLHNSFDNVVAGNLVLGARGQPLSDLVDTHVRTSLAGSGGEIANDLRGALLSPAQGIGKWYRAAQGAAAQPNFGAGGIVVIEDTGTSDGKSLAAKLKDRCVQVLPLNAAPMLPAQVMQCE